MRVEDALWELVGAGSRPPMASRACACSSIAGAARSRATSIAAHRPRRRPVRKWQEAIQRARTRDRERPGHALRCAADRRGPLVAAARRASRRARSTPRRPRASCCSRYGVVFRDLLARESSLPPWRDLLVALRRLEARGEIRGGRFVTGFVGEQFALPEALDELRGVRQPGAVRRRLPGRRDRSAEPRRRPVAGPARAGDRRQRGALPRRPAGRVARGRRARARARRSRRARASTTTSPITRRRARSPRATQAALPL